jgi:hypothetical protein
MSRRPFLFFAFLLLLACHAGAPKTPRSQAPRAAAEYVPQGIDGLVVLDVQKASGGSLGMAVSPVFRETALYRRFLAQSGIDLLTQSDSLVVATDGLGSEHPEILFVLEGSFEPMRMQRALIGEAAGGAVADAETVYLVQPRVGVAFPRPGVVMVGSSHLVELALLVSIGKETAALRASPMRELMAGRQGELRGAVLLPEDARQRVASSASVFGGAWAISFEAKLAAGTEASSRVELAGSEAAAEAARQLADLIAANGQVEDPLLDAILSSMEIGSQGQALTLNFSLDAAAAASLGERGRELIGRAIGGQTSKEHSEKKDPPRYEM